MIERYENEKEFRMGAGNWEVFDRFEEMHAAAKEWSQALKGIEKPWLCWKVDDAWCTLQQKLVRYVGWTPVLGYDPRSGPPVPLPGAVVIDFNKHFQLPQMHFYFGLEFLFLWADKLAFWHSDLLCRLSTMDWLANLFENLQDGETAAVPETGGLRNVLNRKRHRYWELVGCTTRSASRDQFEKGCGWWRHFEAHVNGKDPAEKARRAEHYWDHGAGILYWKNNYGGTVRDVPLELVEEGHCSTYKNKKYVRLTPNDDRRNLGIDLGANYQLEEVSRSLGISHLL